MTDKNDKQQYELLQDALSKYFGVDWSIVRTPDRHEELCQIRRAYSYMAHEWFGRNYRDIAYDMGRVNHVTAMHHTREFINRILTNSIEDIYLFNEMRKKLGVKLNFSDNAYLIMPRRNRQQELEWEAIRLMEERYDRLREETEGKFVTDSIPKRYNREIGIYSDGASLGDFNDKTESLEARVKENIMEQAKRFRLSNKSSEEIMIRFYEYQRVKKQ